MQSGLHFLTAHVLVCIQLLRICLFRNVSGHVLFYSTCFFTINGMVVSIICCHNVSLLQSQSFFGSEPTLPPTVFICTSHNQQTPHSHTNTTSKCMLTICSLPQTAKTHKTQTHRQTLSAQTSEKEIDWSS